MAQEQKSLSQKSVAVLDLIAKGNTYEQILVMRPTLTYLDIFNAAQKALNIAKEAGSDYSKRLAELRKAHPRAYGKWNDEEDAKLRRLVQSGQSLKGVMTLFQRGPGGILSRMVRIGLAKDRDAAAQMLTPDAPHRGQSGLS